MDDRDANARLDTHEAVCAERYAGLTGQLKRIEGWCVAIIGAGFTLAVGLLLHGGFH